MSGRAIASAVATYVTNKIGANTMFATHFHELTSLANENSKIKNFKVLVQQIDNEIVFLHKVVPGIEGNSFGIDVAKMAGLPKEIIENARKIFDGYRSAGKNIETSKEKTKSVGKDNTIDDLSSIRNSELIQKLHGINVNKLSPLEALVLINDLKKQADEI